jgi:hypothetical protein
MEFIYITNDPYRAQTAQLAGVDKVMVDLEINGKEDRQGHLNTVISRHTFTDIIALRKVLNTSKLLVRVNPVHDGSSNEISRCIDLGADILMLPMFTSAVEADEFIRLVDGRVGNCLLLETGQALARIHEIVQVPGIDEIHIGLNDLHLSLKLNFMFELLSGGIVDYLASVIRDKGIKFGFGGIARLEHGTLPAELILSEHLRVGSSQVILSRDFNALFDNSSAESGRERFCQAVQHLREYIGGLTSSCERDLLANSLVLKKIVHRLVKTRYLNS